MDFDSSLLHFDDERRDPLKWRKSCVDKCSLFNGGANNWGAVNSPCFELSSSEGSAAEFCSSKAIRYASQ